MAFIKKINPSSKANPDTGFGTQASQVGGRFINKDGSFNIRKQGWSKLKTMSLYSNLLDISWAHFFLIIVSVFLLINFLFTGIYLLIGHDQLQGLFYQTYWGKVKEVFFFSTQTFTTVGYGRINPLHDGANLIASFESMSGWLFFAIVTGLLYGRFTRPRAYLAFSENALIAPYKDGVALMFRLVPYKIKHHLADAKIVVNIAFTVLEEGIQQFRFYQLSLERHRVDTLNMNWTVVHPIDEQSPLLNFTEEDLKTSDVELYVQINGFSPVFSATVMQNTSYTYKEIVWGAKFKPMYRESEDGNTTILELDKLNKFDRVALPLKNEPIIETALSSQA
jgi:inward rectifier potassium channel